MSTIKHVAIIMDGNGRWAQSRGRPRIWGHVRGSSVVSTIVEKADDLGLSALTLYAFSTENWSRPVKEVSTLFHLLKKFLLKERAKIIKNKICFRVIGDISNLPQDTRNIILALEDETKKFTGLKLSFAFSYGSRKELIDAINKKIEESPGEKITAEELERNFYRNDIGDVDLLIRTGGDQRISNFMLWQSAYAELYFSQTKWPEFSTKEFELIINKVAQRERRFGYISSQVNLDVTSKLADLNRTQVKVEDINV